MHDAPPPNIRPLSLAGAAGWTLAALSLHVFLLGLTEAMREGAFFDLVSRTACAALAYAVVLSLILRLHEPTTSIRHVLAVRAPSVVAIVLAIAVGAALSVPSEWLDQVLQARYPRTPEETEALDRFLSVTTLEKRVTLIITVVLLYPALDELFFRGALFTPLRRTYRAELVVVASAAFEALATLSPRAMISLFLASLVFAWMRATTSSVVPSIAARAAYYGVAIVPIALGGNAPKPTGELLAGSGVVLLLGLGGLVLLGRREGGRAG